LELILKHFPDLSPIQISQFEQLYDLYLHWNKKINVISRKDIDHLYTHHILHSLSIAKIIELGKAQNILDFGTGGGFPGIPLAIYYPKVQFHLVDSINKKITVVDNIAKALSLENITTSHQRVEDIKGLKFDAITCRAVASTEQIIAWTAHLLKKNSLGWLLLKGGDLTNELATIKNHSIKIHELYPFFKISFFKEKYLLNIK